MIEDAAQAVIVPWSNKGRQLIDQLMQEEPPGRGFRRLLQRYTVPVYENIFKALVGHDVEIRHEACPVLLNDSMYDPQMGFRPDLSGFHEPDSLIL